MPRWDVDSPNWWLDRLGRELLRRSSMLHTFENYYTGKHNIHRFMSERFAEAFGGMFRNFADNWCELVVDALEERLRVEGFRFGEDPAADGDAWAIWQANNLDAESMIAHTEAIKNGISYILVESDGDRKPLITVEHPLYMVHEHNPGNRRELAAALKLYQSEDGKLKAVVWRPDVSWKWESAAPVKVRSNSTWETLMGHVAKGEPEEEQNDLGAVPVVPLVNRPGLLYPYGRSEIANVIPTQDAVNKVVIDMLVASNFAAFRQKWATGIEIPKDPETGDPVEEFKAAVDRIWHTAAKDAKFGEFESADLTNYVKAIETLVQHIASQTRTPPHYFYLKGEFPSGESLKSAETGLVAKARNRMTHFGEAWEKALRYAFKLKGDRRAETAAAETIWGDPETRTEAEKVDAAIKRLAIGVPARQLQEDVGYTPTQIARFEAMEATGVLREVLSQMPQDGEPAQLNGDVDDLVKRSNAVGILIRSGFTPEAALRAAGLDADIEHTGLLPVTLSVDG